MRSVFEIIGPSMIGPSSSHTAGAVRLGLMAQRLLGDVPSTARIELHGSFAATGKGHATDRGIVAGLLGFAPDDERLKDSITLASNAKLEVQLCEADLGEGFHPNSVRMDLVDPRGGRLIMTGSSIGGGNIQINGIDGFPTLLNCDLDALVLWHQDVPGLLARVTAVLACVDANIATIRTSRHHRGEAALTVIEVDAPIAPEALALLRRLEAINKLRSPPRVA